MFGWIRNWWEARQTRKETERLLERKRQRAEHNKELQEEMRMKKEMEDEQARMEKHYRLVHPSRAQQTRERVAELESRRDDVMDLFSASDTVLPYVDPESDIKGGSDDSSFGGFGGSESGGGGASGEF